MGRDGQDYAAVAKHDSWISWDPRGGRVIFRLKAEATERKWCCGASRIRHRRRVASRIRYRRRVDSPTRYRRRVDSPTRYRLRVDSRIRYWRVWLRGCAAGGVRLRYCRRVASAFRRKIQRLVMSIVPEKVVRSSDAPPPLAVPRRERLRPVRWAPDMVIGMSVLIDPLNELASI
jgi:hypothetical protein